MSTTAPQAERTAPSARTLRIGELAELTGTTPRTIRYWEEIGLLGGEIGRAQGKHRLYTEADVERVREVVRMRDLLNLSLDQLARLLDAESARRHLREEYHQTEAPAKRRRILQELDGHIGTQLELVEGRLGELTELRDELRARRARVKRFLSELPGG
ncbi:MAG TPA: MerR family transcriptional regulator [Solirubrobacteraceae bacterium]|nr:MerR family transcriptional regulator [Solirubrobacteraceae bacterium]